MCNPRLSTWFVRRRTVLARLGVVHLALVVMPAVTAPSPVASAETRRPAVVEPPTNPYLADSPWPMTHRNPYNQASTPLAGPTDPDEARADFLPGEPVPITLAMSSPYPDGRRIVWGNTLRHVFKLNVDQGRLKYYDRLPREQERRHGLSGAYSLVDRDGTFFVPRDARIEAYGNRERDDPDSDIVLLRSFRIPPDLARFENERIVGMNLTYDGRVALVTNRGLVGVVARDFQEHHFLRLHDGAQQVSNSLAVDEDGGIYVVSDATTSRVQWSAGAEAPLAVRWSLPYRTRAGRGTGRLGAGSGTTPTLIGTGDDDKLLAICDGQRLMRLVLYWRDEIPADWDGLEERDRRVAAEIPVRFGDPGASFTTTEQSLVVRGNEIAVVSNDYGSFRPIVQRYIQRRLGEDLHSATIYKSNDARIAPHGMEKFRWDPLDRRLESVWANRRFSCPNGVPAMSEATGMLYCIGQRGGQWTLEALDWETGRSVFHRRLSSAARYNSFFAAAQIGDDGSILTGSYGGILKFGPGD